MHLLKSRIITDINYSITKTSTIIQDKITNEDLSSSRAQVVESELDLDDLIKYPVIMSIYDALKHYHRDNIRLIALR